jgi:NAD(P)-dependent dehydrogenase (short-subunit alcohol dehydrogenase family)
LKSLRNYFGLEGKRALVTGAAGHLGRTFSQALAGLGTELILLDRNEEALRSLAGELEKEHAVSTLVLAADLADDQTLARAVDLVSAGPGTLDLLVNNAAYVGTSDIEGWAVSFEKQKLPAWRQALEVNLTSVFALTQACTPALRLSPMASVVNIASIYGLLGPDWSLYDGTPMANPAAYAASKGGLIQLTRWMATTLAPAIRVNSISPGGIQRGQDPAFIARYEARTPLKRMAREEDLAGALLFLAGRPSSYITGQNLVVDGGWTAW